MILLQRIPKWMERDRFIVNHMDGAKWLIVTLYDESGRAYAGVGDTIGAAAKIAAAERKAAK